jgi:hypothetical protein
VATLVVGPDCFVFPNDRNFAFRVRHRLVERLARGEAVQFFEQRHGFAIHFAVAAFQRGLNDVEWRCDGQHRGGPG